MIKCPVCDVELDEVEVLETHLDRCPECNGLWVEYEEMQLVKKGDTDDFDRIAKEVEKDLDKEKKTSQKREEKISCPRCNVPMHNYEYSYPSGIWIDRCEKCKGTWLEEGELTMIDNFLEELPQYDKKLAEIMPLLNKTEFDVEKRYENIKQEADSLYKSKSMFSGEKAKETGVDNLAKLALLEEVLGKKDKKKKKE